MDADDSLEVEFKPWEILRILDEEAVDFVVIGGLAAVLHGSTLPTMLNLVTTYGDLDVAFHPAGPKTGFDEWNADAVAVDIGDSLVVRLAALADVIQSKAAANRPKDERALPYLESLQDQIREKGTESNS